MKFMSLNDIKSYLISVYKRSYFFQLQYVKVTHVNEDKISSWNTSKELLQQRKKRQRSNINTEKHNEIKRQWRENSQSMVGTEKYTDMLHRKKCTARENYKSIEYG